MTVEIPIVCVTWLRVGVRGVGIRLRLPTDGPDQQKKQR